MSLRLRGPTRSLVLCSALVGLRGRLALGCVGLLDLLVVGLGCVRREATERVSGDGTLPLLATATELRSLSLVVLVRRVGVVKMHDGVLPTLKLRSDLLLDRVSKLVATNHRSGDLRHGAARVLALRKDLSPTLVHEILDHVGIVVFEVEDQSLHVPPELILAESSHLGHCLSPSLFIGAEHHHVGRLVKYSLIRRRYRPSLVSHLCVKVAMGIGQ